jgi:hypothetical protein
MADGATPPGLPIHFCFFGAIKRWSPTGTVGYRWVPLGTVGYRWVPLGSLEIKAFFKVICQCPWLKVGVIASGCVSLFLPDSSDS